MPVRLRDVAEQANVSMATASYVLRDSPGARISGPTRERVLEVADAIGYRRRVKQPASSLVGLLLDTKEDVAVGRRLIAGLVDAAWAAGALIAMVPDDRGSAEQALASAKALTPRFDGLIRVGSVARSSVGVVSLDQRTVVLDVSSGPVGPAGDHPLVAPDDRRAATTIAIDLHQHGHRRVLVMGAESEAGLAGRWVEGLGSVLARESVTVRVGPLNMADSFAHLRHDDRPTALVCMSPRTAAAVQTAAARAGLSIPKDLQLVVRGDGNDHGCPPVPGARQLDLPFTDLCCAAIAALPPSGQRPPRHRSAAPVTMVPVVIETAVGASPRHAGQT